MLFSYLHMPRMPDVAAPPVIIANAHAGGGTSMHALQMAVRTQTKAVLHITHSPEEAAVAMRTHWADGTRRFMAAGGDGTLHHLVNELHSMQRLVQANAVGLIPIGTGNDLAQTLQIPESLPEALHLACSAPPRRMDAVAILRDDVPERLALNVCAGGFGGYIDKALARGPKSLLGPLAYMMGAARVLPKLRRYACTLTIDEQPVHESETLNVIVANAPTAAGGIRVAPGAFPFDQTMHVVTVRPGSAAAVAGVVRRVLQGDYTTHPLVQSYTGTSLDIVSDPPMVFNADGELLSYAPSGFRMLPQRVPIAAPPNL